MKLIKCRLCGRSERPYARGMSKLCYERARKLGILWVFPCTRWGVWRAKRKAVAHG